MLDESTQRYRVVVLDAFALVEDQLSMLVQYGEAAQEDNAAAAPAQRALSLATIRYRQGAASYLEVVAAQTAHLQAQRARLEQSSAACDRAIGACSGWGGALRMREPTQLISQEMAWGKSYRASRIGAQHL